MKAVKTLTLCAGLLLAVTANVASARPGGGFGHGGFSGAHFGGHSVSHGGAWGGRPGWHGGRGYGGGWYGGIYGGIYLDPWLYADAYPYYGNPGVGYDAYPDAVVAPVSPPVNVVPSGGVAVSPGSQQGDWYYCQSPAGYYPYIKSCGQAWQRVPARPPGAQ